MKNTKLMIAGLTAAMVMSICTVAPVYAKDNKVEAVKADNVFVSSDGILSIELPDDSWKEVQDPNKWIVLSDGENEITLRHFSNGAGLPGIVTADDQYSKTITSALSTKNEVFIATGLVANTDEEDEINDSLQSIKILIYDTKLAVKPEAPAPAQKPAATPAPAPAEETETVTEKEPEREAITFMIYSEGSGRPVNITGSDDAYYDGYGNRYYGNGDGTFSDENGATYTLFENESAPDEEVIGLVSDGSGRPVSIMENEDGVYTDEEGVEYYENDDGTFTDQYDATYQISGIN